MEFLAGLRADLVRRDFFLTGTWWSPEFGGRIMADRPG